MNMDFQYFVPVHIISGENCVRDHGEIIKQFGRQALIVTGKSSAKNGALDDMVFALNKYLSSIFSPIPLLIEATQVLLVLLLHNLYKKFYRNLYLHIP